MSNEYRRRDGCRVRAIQWTGAETADALEVALGAPLPERIVVPIDGFPVLIIPGSGSVPPFAVRPGHWLVRSEDGELEVTAWGNEGVSFTSHVRSSRRTDDPWARLQEDALCELTDVAQEMAVMLREPRQRMTAAAYQDLADAALRLRLIRHGNDRLRERQQTVS